MAPSQVVAFRCPSSSWNNLKQTNEAKDFIAYFFRQYILQNLRRDQSAHPCLSPNGISVAEGLKA